MQPPGEHLREKTLRTLKMSLGRIWKRRCVTITEYDPTYKVAYLGNVLTGWAKGEGCVEKPLSTLWRNYTCSARPDVCMKLTVTGSGLKAVTKEHGLTEYWSHRLTYCCAPAAFPRVFCWVYRHEGRRLKQELRCHAVLCAKEAVARRMAQQLAARLQQALSDFKRDKVSRQNARLSLANAVYDNPSLPRRKLMLAAGPHNYRPPLERSKSAPKLMVIEESLEEEVEEESTPQRPQIGTNYGQVLSLIQEHQANMQEEQAVALRGKRVAFVDDGESDEGASSLQSVSSSGSSDNELRPTFRRCNTLPEDEVLEDSVEWRPIGIHDPLRRCNTFPPPGAADDVEWHLSESEEANINSSSGEWNEHSVQISLSIEETSSPNTEEEEDPEWRRAQQSPSPERENPEAVDWRPAAGGEVLHRSTTFPPATFIHEPQIDLDSLSEEDDIINEEDEQRGKKGKEEEDNVSDESGYAELVGDAAEDYQVKGGMRPCVQV